MNTTMFLAAKPQGGDSMQFLIIMVVIFAIMYFFMIRPQQKKQKEIRNFQNSLQEGSKVVTGGGIYGTIKKVDIATGKIELEIAKGVVITVDKGSVFADVAASATVSKEK
ncbi:preprotein translocase subunit YajC [Prevotella pectinovora]|uniref:preprotein translocase subunit YajC n=1 Tax=Prevotella pectinovora TaxID=1602169 RepID=UPI00352160A4